MFQPCGHTPFLLQVKLSNTHTHAYTHAHSLIMYAPSCSHYYKLIMFNFKTLLSRVRKVFALIFVLLNQFTLIPWVCVCVPVCGYGCMQALDDGIFVFFAGEMVVKMVALGVIGQSGYLGDTWNRLDFFIVIVGWVVDVFSLSQTHTNWHKLARARAHAHIWH